MSKTGEKGVSGYVPSLEGSHRMAMDIMALADASQNPHRVRSLAKTALAFELEALTLLPEGPQSEPTISIHRSYAAFIAVKAGDTVLAGELAEKALAGDLPEHISEQLKALQESLKTANKKSA